MSESPFRRRAPVFALVAIGALAGIAALAMPFLREPGTDRSYDTSVAAPALKSRRPGVFVDAGHNNTHSITGRFKPFADLLRADGCKVESISPPFTPALLARCDVLVIVNARGPDDRRDSSAFTDTEIAAIRDWVSAGGALLLAADHHPFGPAGAALANAFSIQMVGGWCEDGANALPATADTGAIAFRRDNGLLGDHPILRGRSAGEAVMVVGTFTGQSLVAPEGAAPLLLCAETAVDLVPVSEESVTTGNTTTTTFETEESSAAGHCQGLAMPFGSGRVVVLGEAAMLSAQIDAKSGLKFGMNVAGVDNRQFVLNCVRWLAGELN